MQRLYYPSPIGLFFLEAADHYLERLSIEPQETRQSVTEKADLQEILGQSAILKETTQQLDAYFQGKLYHFDLPLKPASTPKGEAMRQAIMNIAYGSTASYRQVAMGIDSGARAIGQSCARNPFTLIVPCHRVVKADGSLGQYSSGNGVSTKCWLLDHEKRYRPA